MNVPTEQKGKRKRSAANLEATLETAVYRVTESAQRPKPTTSLTKIMEFPISRIEERIPKETLITDDYEISNHVLGLGINGKVVQCYDRETRDKYALKVI